MLTGLRALLRIVVDGDLPEDDARVTVEGSLSSLVSDIPQKAAVDSEHFELHHHTSVLTLTNTYSYVEECGTTSLLSAGERRHDSIEMVYQSYKANCGCVVLLVGVVVHREKIMS